MSTRPSAGDDYESKMEDARRFSPLLCKHVCERFGLPSDAVTNLEMADDGDAVDRDLDGIDAVLEFPHSGETTVAMRTRPDHPKFVQDFSLRTKSRDDETESEWYKLEAEYTSDPYEGEIADWYVFGVHEGALLVDCYLIRTDRLQDCIWGDKSDPEEEYPEKKSEKGGKARYIPVGDISRAVVAELV